MKTFENILLFILITIFFEHNGNAQNLSFKHYGLKEGLSQETVRCMVKDSSGFLWLGTQDGLNRFDSSIFKTYRNKKKDSLSISGNFINVLLEDNKGNIWIGTNDNGICVYDFNTDSFKKTTLKTGNCTSISKDEDGNIYATILNKGIVVFRKQKQEYDTKIISNVNSKKLHFTTTQVVNKQLYLGTTEGKLFVAKNLKKSTFRFEEITFNQFVGSINKIFFYQNQIWLGTSQGLFTLNPQNNKLTQINITHNIADEKLKVESIAVNKDIFYIGTDSGLFIANNFNVTTSKFNNIDSYRVDKYNTNTITSSRVYDILIDNELLFIGTNNLDLASLKTPIFKNINTTSKPAINNHHVLCILKHQGYTFIGTRKGLNCIDPHNRVTYITRENTNHKLANDVIRGMSVDAKNNLWLATIKGVSVINLTNFNPKKPRIKSIYHNTENTLSLSTNNTRNVYVDHNKTVWITTYGGGINRFIGNLETDTYSFIQYKSNDNKNTISSNYTYNITQDKDLAYWITSEKGLNKLTFLKNNYKEPKFTNFYHQKNNSNSLNSNTTLHTYHDKNNILWIATQDGFHQYNKESKTFMRYHNEHGLNNTFVYHILEDNLDNLWLSTNGGLYRFNKNTKEISNYTPKDGLQSTEFNLGAAYKDKKTGILYFGGINGYNYFKPSEVDKQKKESKLIFTGFTIKNKEVKPIASKVLQQNITSTKEIQINYNDFPVNLSYSALDFRPNSNIQYVYKLLPEDKQWNSLKDKNSIQLLNLTPKSYTLQIQGTSRGKIWLKPPLQLHLKVIPPWYKSTLAYVLYLASFLWIMYFFYSIILQRRLADQESVRLKDLDNLKSRFITNITHEFRTPLTIILGFLDNLKEEYFDKKETKNSLNKIEKNSNDLLSLVNQMLDLAKLEQGSLQLHLVQNDIIVYLKYIVNSFESIANFKNIKVLFKTDVEQLYMDFDAEKTRQIFSNLISNALKFSSENTTITMHIKHTKNNIEIHVLDEGYGIPNEDLPQIFDRFYQVNDSNFKVSQGTGIGLALTKELVELMSGSITVTSKIKQGTNFKVSIPIKNTAIVKTIEQEKIKQLYGETVLEEENIYLEDTNRILIVEDNVEIANYIQLCLQQNYKIIKAQNGKEGLEIAMEQIPDLIISDVMMPIMDGFELTKKLQNNEVTNHIPIIILTSKTLQEDKLEGLSSGADAYLIKPFSKQELLLRIQKLIAKRAQLQEKYQVNFLPKQIKKEIIVKDKNLIFLNKAITIIHKNIENSNFNAMLLAKELTISDSQLYRKLKAISNTSTSVFIRKIRLKKAKELLQTTDLTIAEIAYTTGFNDPSWFSRIFKEEFKISPKGFRKEL